MKQWLALFVLALAAGTLGWFGGRWLSQHRGETSVSMERPADAGAADLVGSRRPDFALPGLDGQVRHIGEWQGKVILVNFWATWCGPCREEMPMLQALQSEMGSKGLQVVGVALDQPDATQRFAAKLGVQYPILVNDPMAEDISVRYGDDEGVLPYSVLVGRDGIVRDTFIGKLQRDRLREAVGALL